VPEYNTLGAVDLGSNSFHLAIGRVVGEQIYPLDSLKETVRLGAGLGADKRLDDDTQERALGALRQFAERLAGMPRGSVRVVGTNALRVAKNSKQFVRKAESALGFPIEVISGHEEARWFAAFRRRYVRTLDWSLAHRRAVVGAARLQHYDSWM